MFVKKSNDKNAADKISEKEDECLLFLKRSVNRKKTPKIYTAYSISKGSKQMQISRKNIQPGIFAFAW